MSWGPSPFGHVRGQTPAVAARAKGAPVRRLSRDAAAPGHGRSSLVRGQTPAVAWRDA